MAGRGATVAFRASSSTAGAWITVLEGDGDQAKEPSGGSLNRKFEHAAQIDQGRKVLHQQQNTLVCLGRSPQHQRPSWHKVSDDGGEYQDASPPERDMTPEANPVIVSQSSMRSRAKDCLASHARPITIQREALLGTSPGINSSLGRACNHRPPLLYANIAGSHPGVFSHHPDGWDVQEDSRICVTRIVC